MITSLLRRLVELLGRLQERHGIGYLPDEDDDADDVCWQCPRPCAGCRGV